MGTRQRYCPATIYSASLSKPCCATGFVIGSPEECYEQLRPCWEEAGANFLIFRTHWSGMPVGHALASMRLISDELLAGSPADYADGCEQVKPPGEPRPAAPEADDASN